MRAAVMGAASAAPASHGSALASLRALDTKTLERAVDMLIDILNERAGDADTEDSEEDCCIAGDDIGSKDCRALSFNCSSDHGPGDPADTEENGDEQDTDLACIGAA